jgi:hypothetical protein
MGLLVQLTVEDKFVAGDIATGLGKDVHVKVSVLGPSWVTATNVALFANGLKVREQTLATTSSPGARAAKSGVQAELTWTLSRPSHDVHLVAIATGPAVTAPFWAIPRPYQPTSPKWEGCVIGSTNPILLDADGDGSFSSAHDYARRLVAGHSGKPADLVAALRDFDEAVAAQAASLCAAAGRQTGEGDFADALKSAAPPTRRGFAAYAETQR